MAEFKDVITNARRLCRSRDFCNGCPFSPADEVCYFDSMGDAYNDVDLEKIESIVMQWAKEHPEKKYPTWIEWQQKTFPNATNRICPKEFISREEAHCIGNSCDECRRQQIPESIAVKLGLKKE